MAPVGKTFRLPNALMSWSWGGSRGWSRGARPRTWCRPVVASRAEELPTGGWAGRAARSAGDAVAAAHRGVDADAVGSVLRQFVPNRLAEVADGAFRASSPLGRAYVLDVACAPSISGVARWQVSAAPAHIAAVMPRRPGTVSAPGPAPRASAHMTGPTSALPGGSDILWSSPGTWCFAVSA